MIAALLLAISLKGVDGTPGYAAYNFENGEWVEYNGRETFPMAGVVRLPVAIALLQRVDREQFHLSDVVTIDGAHGQKVTMSLGELFEEMLRESDNTALDKVLSMIGGPEVVTKTIQDLHIKNIRIDLKESTTTPNAMIELLQHIYRHKEGLSKESHDLLLKVMSESMTGPHRIREAVPAGCIVAHETGAMPGTTNDVALVTSPDGKHHMAIAVFTKRSKMNEAERDAVVLNFASTAYERFTR